MLVAVGLRLQHPSHLQVEGIDMIFVDASMGLATTEVEAIEKAAKSSKKLLDCKALSCSATKASTSDVCLIGKPRILWGSTLFLDSSRFGVARRVVPRGLKMMSYNSVS